MVGLEYLAGIFDGEGSISIQLSRGKRRLRPLHWLTVNVANTHEGVVRLFYDRYGGDIYCQVRKPGVWAPSWRWRASSERAAAFLEELRPYLIVKAEAADVAIEFQRTKKRYKTLPPEELEKREALRQQLWKLNGMRPLHYRREIETLP